MNINYDMLILFFFITETEDFNMLEEQPADYVPASPDYSPIIPLPE